MGIALVGRTAITADIYTIDRIIVWVIVSVMVINLATHEEKNEHHTRE
jgi:hypothetical protein